MMGADWHLVIHGSNGQTATADGKSYYDAKQKMTDAIQVVQTRDEAIALPADVLLARAGEQEIRLKVAGTIRRLVSNLSTVCIASHRRKVRLNR